MTAFEKYDNFRKEHGDDHLKTLELAQELARLKKEWWGSNLVSMGIKREDNGTFTPEWNVWD